ncbi:MAG: LytTR family transcriptional regulator DNA-binding domain-containing protein [Bacteroidaceae bacterium]|nr:LytTR family transcriptional regulator DNA-binding domain-containing protein [Bacteroidaceae bacterium]
MEWLRISTSTEMVRVATDEIVYVRADGNYSDLVLTNGKRRKMTFQLNYFDNAFHNLQNNTFVRVGRSLIVNTRYIYVINLTEQQLILSGGHMKEEIVFYGQTKFDQPKDICLSRDALKQLKELLETEKWVYNG